MFQPRLRPEVVSAKAYSPGRTIEEIRAAYGLGGNIVKLASNENPLGVSPLVRKAVEKAAPSAFRYPRLGYPRLREALATDLGVDESRIVCGNGSDEVIDLLVRALVRPGVDNVVAARPSFSVYGSQTKLCGGEFRQVDLNPDFSQPLSAMAHAADENTALVFVTSPDNPSGVATGPDRLAELAAKLPGRTVLAVDEAYVHFLDDPTGGSVLAKLQDLPNVVILRTFSKAYGLAGFRLGLGVMHPELAAGLLKVQIPFSVNLLAEEAGLAALEDTVFFEETVRVTREGREYLTRELAALGCDPVPSQANFIMFTPPAEAACVCEGLLQRGVIVRPLASYGLPDKIRVSIGRMDENEVFVAALREILGGAA